MNAEDAHPNIFNRSRKQLGTAGVWFTFSVVRRIYHIALSAPCNVRLWHLLCGRPLSSFSRKHPRLFYKHLDNYVAKTFSARTRLHLLHGHYKYIKHALRPAFLKQLLTSPIKLWQDDHSHSIELAYPPNKATEWEGELCLTFSSLGNPLYRLIFVIMASPVAGVGDTPCLVITSIQGKHDLQQIRQATLECNDISPAHLLMAAIGGLATGLGGFQLLGVGDRLQLVSEASRRFSYDTFFDHYGEPSSADGLYQISLPFIERALTARSASHRKRSRKKRLVKQELSQQVAGRTALLLNQSLDGVVAPATRLMQS